MKTNRLIRFFPRGQYERPFAIVETACFPCSFYFGPVHRDDPTICADNETGNWHRTLAECEIKAKAMGFAAQALTNDPNVDPVFSSHVAASLYAIGAQAMRNAGATLGEAQ